ncbi:hypothetical protein MishRS11D_12780 [Methylomagnum ishizawai]|nr:hypothetical protein MishRS11D_12780 [Methylomagnum ishizawai]
MIQVALEEAANEVTWLLGPAAPVEFFTDSEADAGDDTDTGMLQRALDAMARVGGTVLLAARDYTATQLIFRSYTDDRRLPALRGAACNMDIDYGPASNNGSRLLQANGVDDDFVVVEDGNHLLIENVFFHGSRTHQYALSRGIYFKNIASAHKERSGYIRNCRIENFRGSGIFCNANRNNVYIHKCLINYNGIWDTGTAQGGGANYIILRSGANTLDDAYKGATVDIIEGTGAGQSRTVTTSVGATKWVYVDSDWDTDPDNTSIYQVYVHGDGITFSAAFDHRVVDCDVGLNSRHGIFFNASAGRVVGCDFYGNHRNGLHRSGGTQTVFSIANAFDGNDEYNVYNSPGWSKTVSGALIIQGCRFLKAGSEEHYYSHIYANNARMMSVMGCEFQNHTPASQPFRAKFLIETDGTTDGVMFIGNMYDWGWVNTTSTDSLTPGSGNAVVGGTLTVNVADTVAPGFSTTAGTGIILNSAGNPSVWISGAMTAITDTTITIAVSDVHGSTPTSNWLVYEGKAFAQAITNDESKLIIQDAYTGLNFRPAAAPLGQGESQFFNRLGLAPPASNPRLYFRDPLADDDEQIWYIATHNTNDGSFIIRAVNSAETDSNTVVRLGRNGYVGTYITLGGDPNAEAFRVTSTENQVNAIEALGATSGNPAQLKARGTGSDASLKLAAQGGGYIILNPTNIPLYTDNAAAAAGGVPVGAVYRVSTAAGMALMIRN